MTEENPRRAEARRAYLRLPQDLHRQVVARAKAEGVPLNWLIIRLLDMHFGISRKPGPRQLG